MNVIFSISFLTFLPSVKLLSIRYTRDSITLPFCFQTVSALCPVKFSAIPSWISCVHSRFQNKLVHRRCTYRHIQHFKKSLFIQPTHSRIAKSVCRVTRVYTLSGCYTVTIWYVPRIPLRCGIWRSSFD